MTDRAAPRVFKLFLMVSPNCRAAVDYMLANCKQINRMGIVVRPVLMRDRDLTADMVEALRAKGIESFPVLVLDTGKRITGAKEIRQLFDRNLRDFRTVQLSGQVAGQNPSPMQARGGRAYKSGGDEFGAPSSTADYFKKVLGEADNDNGDALGEPGQDFNAALKRAEQSRMRAPAPGRGGAGGAGGAGGVRPTPVNTDPDDNIAVPAHRGGVAFSNGGGDADIGSRVPPPAAHSSEFDNRDVSKAIAATNSGDQDDDILAAWAANHLGGGNSDW